MATNVFQNPRTSIPKDSDPRITRVAFDESEVGARKSFLPKLSKRSGMSIVHVKSGS